MSSGFLKLGVSTLIAFSFATSVKAANTIIDLQAIDVGIYTGVTATHIASNTSISIQQDSVYADRNFFVFDFSTLNMSNLVSAELYINNAWNFSTSNQISYSLFDVSTTIADLRDGGNGQFSIYNDLGTGTEYANLQIINPTRYDNLTMTFNQAGIDEAKSSTGLFAFGGRFTSTTNGVAFLFADNENTNAPFSYGLRLTFSETVTAVPEANTYAMLSAGLIVLGAARRRNLK